MKNISNYYNQSKINHIPIMDNFNLPDGGDIEGGDDVCSLFASIIDQRRSVELLLNWLRQSQSTCTESNCLDGDSVLPTVGYDGHLSNAVDETGTFALVVMFVVGVLTLFAMNLSRNRQANSRAESKRSRLTNGSNNDDHSGFRRDSGDDDSTPAI